MGAARAGMAMSVFMMCWSSALLAHDVDAGARVALSYQFGTQGNRLGATVGTYARADATDSELQLTLSLYRTFSHMETRTAGRERQLILGLTQGVGGRSPRERSRDWSLGANNSQRRHSLSVYSILYWDTYETSQRVRGIGFSAGDFSVRYENDFGLVQFLADRGDRFRTGGIEIAYRHKNLRRYVVGFNVFTGDPEEGPVLAPGPETVGRYGQYAMVRPGGAPVTAADRSIANAWFGVRGLDLAGGDGVANALGLDSLQVRLGWSSEAIRQVVQNRFHDMILNPHVPLREDARARPYLTFGTDHGQTLYP
ncbi:MAG: polymorphic toxin type 23 domain-containing protein [Pseudomonadota bacterium]